MSLRRSCGRGDQPGTSARQCLHSRRRIAAAGRSHHPAWLAGCLGKTRADANATIKFVRVNGELAGVFAVDAERWRWPWPQRVIKSWRSDLTFDGTPLIARHAGVAAIRAFIAAQSGRPILFQSIPHAGAFRDQLEIAGRELQAPVRVVKRWQRAALRPIGAYADWFDTNFDRKRRKEYRRLRARLGEQGELESLSWSDAEPVQRWIDALFELEAKGWKGRRGTAMAADPQMRAAVTKALHGLAREGSLRFWKIALDGAPIAMMFALVSGSKAFLVKNRL